MSTLSRLLARLPFSPRPRLSAPVPVSVPVPPRRPASAAASSSRWKQRQGRDKYAREAKVQGLKSRAAFKLLEMDAKYRLFKPGQTVVDLGYAPGSWSQVAVERTRPHGRVIGIDLIPAQPPRGVATFQGDFLSPMVRRLVKDFVLRTAEAPPPPVDSAQPSPSPSYIDTERRMVGSPDDADADADADADSPPSLSSPDRALVDLVLSDMSAPWHQTVGFSANSLSNPYRRLMNTSGNTFRDHAGSMDLCTAALQFASDTLRPGGHFVCKFYQGSEDKALEQRLKAMFAKVHREKPESSRSESKESFFVALRRKKGAFVDDS